MTDQLADLFNNLQPEEIPPACYLMQGQLVPTYQSLEFNMSDKLTIKALAQVIKKLKPNDSLPSTNLFNEEDDHFYQEQIKQEYSKQGDLGLAIEQLLKSEGEGGRESNSTNNQQNDNKQLSIIEVHQQLKEIALDEGSGSVQRKIDGVANLLTGLQATSIKFAVRVILGKLRLGFSTMTMIDALSWAKHGDKSESKHIEEAYQKKADIGQLAKGYLSTSTPQEKDNFLNSYEVEVTVPVLPALCQRLNTAQEIIDKMKKVIVEPKYDGLRAQIHLIKENNEVKVQVFTRSLEDVTHMFPELEKGANQIEADSCIFDAEAIGYDPETNELLPFQQTITRKRKHGISGKSEKTPIRFYLFDLLYLNGESLVDRPLSERKEMMDEIISPSQTICNTPYLVTSDPEEVHQYHYRQLEGGLEGAVIKKVDSRYRAGRKGWRWVKIKEKEGERGKLSDSLDCVVLGYYYGKGKRAEFGIGAFLVGVLAKEDGKSEVENEIKTIAKIGTGLTDDQFAQLKKMADEHRVKTKPANYDVPKELKPDVWVVPEIVVEIAADELTLSPLHTAGKALRFPRLIKFRTDKKWTQATTVVELEGIEVA